MSTYYSFELRDEKKRKYSINEEKMRNSIYMYIYYF